MTDEELKRQIAANEVLLAESRARNEAAWANLQAIRNGECDEAIREEAKRRYQLDAAAHINAAIETDAIRTREAAKSAAWVAACPPVGVARLTIKGAIKSALKSAKKGD
jgi:hypothetical protein